MDLPGWNSLFLLLFLDGLFHADALLDAKLLQIFVEIAYSVDFLSGRSQQLVLKLGLVDVDLSIFEVFDLSDGFSALLLILTPVLFTLLHPLLHEGLILHQLLHVGRALLLRDLLYLLHFLLMGCERIVEQGFLGHFKAQCPRISQFLL